MPTSSSSSISISSLPSSSSAGSSSSFSSSSFSSSSSSSFTSSGGVVWKKCPTCGGKDASNNASQSFSGQPIRYSDGSLKVHAQDLVSKGFGQPWGHVRSYSNQLFDGTPGTQGNGWFTSDIPTLLFDTDGTAGVVSSANEVHWFAPMPGGYQAMFGGKSAFELDHDNNQYVKTDSRGGKTLFHANHAQLEGRFKGIIDPKGNKTTAQYNGGKQMTSLVMTSGNQTSGYHYEYQGDNSTSPIKTVSQQVNGQNVRRSNYTYYGKGEAGGMPKDLKTAQVEQFDAESGTWSEINKSYYRYYTTFNDPPAKCTWSFSGKISIDKNQYIFYSQPKGVRTRMNEAFTEAGELLPGKPFWIYFTGNRDVTDNGQC